jgi:predicted transcriptional regulator
MSCQNRIYTACPDIVEYSAEFKRQLAEDLKQEQSYFINQAILDYFNLREKIRICNND